MVGSSFLKTGTLDKTLLGIPSGPHALLGSKLRSTAATSGIVRSISERLLREDSVEVESVEGGSTLIGLKTEWKNLLNKFALVLLSAFYGFLN